MHTGFAKTPEPPYYAVIFTNQRTGIDAGYAAMADHMAQIAAQQPGFLGMESVRDASGFGITVSYWTSEEAITAWRTHAGHRVAMSRGHSQWYEHFETRVARVERTRNRTAAAPDAT